MKNNIRAKKSLGQNFLKSKKVLEKIVKISDLKKDDIVLEVGPGKGALTSKILEKEIKKLIIVEKDERMIILLEEKFSEEIKNNIVEIINDDILKFDYLKYGLKKGNYKIIANLPYYITGKFLRNTLESNFYPKSMTLLLQKEVVERITTDRMNENKTKDNNKNKENILSLSVKAYGKPYYITSVSAKNFSPAPKVDSAVLYINNISKDFFSKNNINEKDFFDFIKIIFSSKRKKIIKNILSNTKLKREYLNNIFDKIKVSKNVRAEDLKINKFLKIFLKIKNNII